MELIELEEIVEDMILQLSYPGLDARSLNIALPMAANDAPVKLYVSALQSESINVRLIALRWFQNRPGAAKHHIKSITGLLENNDPWIRKEAIKTIEVAKSIEPELIMKISSLLKDSDQSVRIAAAKSLGNLLKGIPTANKNSESTKTLKETVIASLREVTNDPVPEVSRKAIKALRKLGAYNDS